MGFRISRLTHTELILIKWSKHVILILDLQHVFSLCYKLEYRDVIRFSNSEMCKKISAYILALKRDTSSGRMSMKYVTVLKEG